MALIMDARALTEREHVKDTFADDLGRVEVFKTHVRLVFFSEQFDQEGGPPVYLVSRGHKLVMPTPSIVPLFGRVLFALGHPVLPDFLDLSRFVN